MNSNSNSNSNSKGAYTYFTANTFITVVAIVLCFYLLMYFYNQMLLAKSNQIANASTARAAPMCPDYWDITAPNICSNSKKLGVCRLGQAEDGRVDFNDNLFKDSRTGEFMKCQWAKTCGVSWQGIDNKC
jgi:hypothetical protein